MLLADRYLSIYILIIAQPPPYIYKDLATVVFP
jgi:hypothetical protein